MVHRHRLELSLAVAFWTLKGTKFEHFCRLESVIEYKYPRTLLASDLTSFEGNSLMLIGSMEHIKFLLNRSTTSHGGLMRSGKHGGHWWTLSLLVCFVSQTASILKSSSCFRRSMRFFFSRPQRTSFCRYCGLNPLLAARRCGSLQLLHYLNACTSKNA